MNEIKKVGILGGTFNPIHIGHLILAETAYQMFDLEHVLLMPNGNPPHKEVNIRKGTFHRMNMLKLAVQDNPHLVPSSFELERTEVVYTYKTLELLTKKNPDTKYYFILGADSLFDLKNWQRPDIICKNAVLLAAVRDDLDKGKLLQQISVLEKEFHAEIHLMDTPNLSFSSHNIRDRIKMGKTVTYYIPKTVEQYIYENKLYLA